MNCELILINEMSANDLCIQVIVLPPNSNYLQDTEQLLRCFRLDTDTARELQYYVIQGFKKILLQNRVCLININNKQTLTMQFVQTFPAHQA